MDVFITQVIALRHADAATQERLRKQYTFAPVKPRGLPSHVSLPSTCLAASQHDFFTVPRDPALLEELARSPQSYLVHDLQPTPPAAAAPPLAFRGQLDPRRMQDQAVAACLASLRKSPWGGGAVLSLPPGYGKTACALYITVELGVKTLVLVHTKVLVEQWRERIEAFVANARVEVVTATKVPPGLGACTHVIVMLQTVLAQAKRGAAGWVDEVRGLVIVDETHHICARTLSQAMATVGARYRLGLSATPERKDGLHPMLHALVGPMAFRCERQENPDVVVSVVRYTCETEEPAPDTFVGQVTRAAADEARQSKLEDVIAKAHAEGRYVIVMSDRLGQLYDFRQRLEECGQIPTYLAVGGGKEDGGGPDMAARPVVLATYAYAAEGMDIPVLNTCILATPRLDVKQCVGRILRSTAKGHRPLVVDVCDDDMPLLRRQFQRRMAFYRKPIEAGGLEATILA